MKQQGEAIKHFSEALGIRPDAEIYSNLGSVLVMMDRIDEAKRSTTFPH
jgi:Flp pilus assembly protein TadD